MRSDLIKEGVEKTPHRAILKALGVTDSEMHRPFIAVVCAASDYVPGHMHLHEISRAVKDGIRNAGGVPFEFFTIGVCDGLAMNHKGMRYSLASRELIADSIEVMLTAHPLDGVVFIPNCDKIVPGMVLAAARMNLPAIFCSGGPMNPGCVQGKRVGYSEIYEAIGQYSNGEIGDDVIKDFEDNACPTCGSCSGMYTANSMNCITEQYSLPAYDGVDPNPVMAPFFILFFGMMMADIGYGLLMLLGSWLFLKKKRPDDRSFMEMIFWCGVTTVVFGAMTGSFFGDFLPQLFKFFDPESTFALPALFSPLDDTMAIMVGSLILGALQVFTGMTVSVVEKCKKGCFMDALFDEITWWIILAGTGLAVLGIGSVSGVPVVLIAGVLMLVYGAGRGKKGFGKVTGFVAAVYNGVTGFFSDILSYVRLMALMLSGAVLAQVFNMLGATTGNVVTFIIIAFVGNMLNLALNLLGCYVHDMRLQFLEFFGRFYKDGGKAYRPLRVRAKHVEIIKEDTKSC